MKVCIAVKPSVALEITTILGANKSQYGRRNTKGPEYYSRFN
ncbi:hypothetical protein [Cellulophaga sp. Z1A5H]|nr:hypothetical protein [Cellulophaga sp. Z1A5H]